jgi:hypothetical protein
MIFHNYCKTHLFGAAERINYTFGYAEGAEAPFRVPMVAGFPVGVRTATKRSSLSCRGFWPYGVQSLS